MDNTALEIYDDDELVEEPIDFKIKNRGRFAKKRKSRRHGKKKEKLVEFRIVKERKEQEEIERSRNRRRR